MRSILLAAVLVALTICLSEGNRIHESIKKVHNILDNCGQTKENLVGGNENNEDDFEKVDRKQNHKHKDGGKAKQHRKEKFHHKQHLSWLNINKDSDCELKCKPGQVCITGPIDTKPLCVMKTDLKKSIKMFHRYQKKEMKAWRQFQKEYHSDNSVVEFDILKKNKKDMAEMKKHYTETHNLDHQKSDSQPFAPDEAGDHEECSTSQFAQMRTRLMGWFHLLHGQDHLARKAHDGNIKHFYKHVSVKKELREHQGNQCECLKSAMWQFLQMDKNGDDSLIDSEMSILKDNSMEPCMQPYLTSCDHNADGMLSSNEWCCCFSNVVAPCFKKVDDIRRSGEPVTYMPRCDKEGYFMREQCSGDSENSYKCWCVDYNGNEFKGTYTYSGRAHCGKISMYGKDKPATA